MVAHRLRRCTNIDPALGECIMFAGNMSAAMIMMIEIAFPPI